MAHKSKKVFFIAAGATVLVFCALFAALLLNIQALKPQIEAVASKALGMEVRIKGRLGIALFPGIGLSLKDISVRNGDVELVTIEKMKVGLEFIALTRREVRIRRIALIRPVVFLVRHKNGTFNFENPGNTPSRRPFAVETMSISEGEIVYTDEKYDERVKADNLDVTMQNLSYGGPEGAEPFRKFSFAGDITCKTLLINKFTLTNLAMRTAMGNGILDINPVRADLLGRTGHGSIHMDATRVSPRFRVRAALSRVRIEELIRVFSPGEALEKSIEGIVNISADLTATGRSTDEVKRSLNGDLSLNGEDLTLHGIDIDALVPKYERSQNFNLVDVGAYFLVGPFGPVITKSYNIGSLYKESRGGTASITRLVSIWNVKNGIAGAIDVALASKQNRIALQGGLNFKNDQFEEVTVAVLDKRGCAVYSQKVRGPFRKPQVEKITVFASLTGPVTNALKKTKQFLQQEKCEVFYAGSVLQPE